MFATTKELGAIKGISEQKVTKLKEIGGCQHRVGPVVATGGHCSRLTLHSFIVCWWLDYLALQLIQLVLPSALGLPATCQALA